MNTELNDNNLVKVTYNFELNPPIEKNKIDYKELVNFLDQLDHLHEKAIQFTFNEISDNFISHKYPGNKNLKFEKVKFDNSFKFSISFFIDIDSLFPYYFAIKTMIGFCEKYGDNTKNLQKTLDRILLCIQKFLTNNIAIRRRIGSKTIILIEDLENNIYVKDLKILLDNPNFKNLYDFFCKSAITIKKTTSEFEFLNQIFEDILIDKD